MCELKYYNGDFEVDRKYYKTLIDREGLLTESMPKKKVIYSKVCSTMAKKPGKYNIIGHYQNGKRFAFSPGSPVNSHF